MKINHNCLVLNLVAVALAMNTVEVHAKSTIGGIVFTNSYLEQSKDINGNKITNSVLDVANNSRFRVRWSNEDSVSMYIEMSLRDEDKDTLRHAYGKWDISETHQLLVGQSSTPFAPLNPNVAMIHNSGQGYGNVSPSRPSQIRYTYKFLNRQGALAIALVDPNKGELARDINGNKTAGSRETKIPRLDIGIAYKTYNWQIFPSIFVHNQDYSAGDKLTSFGYSIAAKTASGPFTLSAEFGSGRNWGNTRMSLSGSDAGDNADAIYDDTGRKLADNDNTGYWIDVGYRFSGEYLKGAVHFIYGSLSSEADNFRDIDSTMVGVSAPIDLPWIAKGFRIRPELFRFEDQDNLLNTTQSKTIAGVQFQFTF